MVRKIAQTSKKEEKEIPNRLKKDPKEQEKRDQTLKDSFPASDPPSTY